MTRRAGTCGLKVPAVTRNPSDSIAFANCLASISVSNDLVCRADGAREDRSRQALPYTAVTYH